MQKGPKRCRPGMRAKLLVGKLDLNGLIGALELNSLCHRLVSRACARRLFVFIHKNNQLTNGGASPTALLRLRGVGHRWFRSTTGPATYAQPDMPRTPLLLGSSKLNACKP